MERVAATYCPSYKRPMQKKQPISNTTRPAIVSTTRDLQTLCEKLAKLPFVTVDTEFLRETTYYSQLCLIQIGEPECGYLIDPLADGIDLKPFLDLMANERVTKVFHSARQDLEIIWNLGGLLPHPLFDTQVAAMVCGYGDSVSYEQLVADLAKATVDKSSRFTDWSRRPLSNAQYDYALSDVTHLVKIYQTLSERLQKNGRMSWLDEEMAILTSPDTYRTEPTDAWRRLAGRVKKKQEIGILMELAAWREREAQNRNVPRGRVLKDDTLIDVAVSAPRDVEALGKLRSLPNGYERSKTGAEILVAVERGLSIDPKTLPAIAKHKRSRSTGAVVDLLKVLLKAISEQEGVATKIIATSDELEEIAQDSHADVPPLHGWRRQLFGDKALALKEGNLSLAINRGKVALRQIDPT